MEGEPATKKRPRGSVVRFKAMDKIFEVDADVFTNAEPSQPLVMMVNRAEENALINVRRVPWLFKWIIYCYLCPGHIPSCKDVGCSAALWKAELDYWGLGAVVNTDTLVEHALEKYQQRQEQVAEKTTIMIDHIIAYLIDLCDPTNPTVAHLMSLVEPKDKTKWSEAYPQEFRLVSLALVAKHFPSMATRLKEMGFSVEMQNYNCVRNGCNSHAYAPAITESFSDTTHSYMTFTILQKKIE